MIEKIRIKLYFYLSGRIQNKLFPKWKEQEKALRKKHLFHSQGAHYKLYWAAMKDMERKQEEELQSKLAKIEWLRPRGRTN